MSAARSLGLTDGNPFGRKQPHDYALSDLGNAERLVAEYGGVLRYCAATGKWFIWSGSHWEDDDTEQVARCAKDVAKALLRESADISDRSEQKAFATWALKSQGEPEIRRAITLARSEAGIAIRTDDLDADPFSLNCTNGTVDLRTGKLRPHNADDLNTKCCGTKFDPRAKAPLFEGFLARIFRQHPDVANYTARVFGYAAFGVTTEQALFVGHGSGANGKSTLVDVVSAAMGDYATKADPDLLLSTRDGSHPTGEADLCGRRLAVCSETNQGRAFDEQLLKRLTGENRLKARFMRQDFFEFEATHTLFLQSNHKPTVRGTDHAIWRRMKLIPFAETIGEDERDLDLPNKLTKELPGILAWIVRGAVEWHRDGLNDPEEVIVATNAYRAAEDVLGQWIDERCMTALDGLSERSQRLYDDYRATCANAGEDAMKQRPFAEELTARGFTKTRDRSGNRWNGIALRENENDLEGSQ